MCPATASGEGLDDLGDARLIGRAQLGELLEDGIGSGAGSRGLSVSTEQVVSAHAKGIREQTQVVDGRDTASGFEMRNGGRLQVRQLGES